MRSGAPGAVRMGCIVGGACGMAMIFDSPLGGILYMWPGRCFCEKGKIQQRLVTVGEKKLCIYDMSI